MWQGSLRVYFAGAHTPYPEKFFGKLVVASKVGRGPRGGGVSWGRGRSQEVTAEDAENAEEEAEVGGDLLKGFPSVFLRDLCVLRGKFPR